MQHFFEAYPLSVWAHTLGGWLQRCESSSEVPPAKWPAP